MCIVMDANETKTCRIVPKNGRYIPDLLLHNQRIKEETVMDINKKEIARAMSLADVYLVGDDGDTLLTPKNFYVKEEETSEETESAGTGSEQSRSNPTTNPAQTSNPDTGKTSDTSEK